MQRRLLAAIAVLACAPAAHAATWRTGTTPHLGQIFAVDRTGEPSWLYGAEDILGDGLTNFTPAEQALDLRTAYAATDVTRVWLRAYVSDAAAADTSLTIFFFIDTDANKATGGGTASTTLSPLFTTENSPGGYEFVFGVTGNATVANVWQWQTTPSPNYVVVTTTPSQVAAEIGADLDPIRIGPADHGYVQGQIDLNVVGLTQACNANLYVRSARASGAADLDMTYTTSCVPATTNGVPTILTNQTCTTDAQCPQNGVCVNGQCVLAQPCVTSADCPANTTCSANGTCIPNGGGTCTAQTNCSGGLACVNGTCTGCTQTSNCASGYVCAPNGTCVVSAGGDGGTGEVEGGAFHCNASPSGSRGALALGVFAALLGLLYVRRRSG